MSETSATRHIEAEELAAYLEARLSDGERARVEGHLAVCDECRAEAVGSFRSLRKERPARPPWTRMALAAAALIVLLLGGDALLELGRPDAPAPFRAPPGAGEFEQVATLEALSPRDGGELAGGAVLFVWRPGPAGSFYRLTLTDAVGDVLWRTSTTDTTSAPEGEVVLRPGGTYFWIVDALLAGGRTATTGARSFTVSGEP